MNPVSKFFGAISYGLYLYHYPLLHAQGLLSEQTISVGRAAAMLALLFIIPIISWYTIERPLLRLKDRLRSVPDRTLDKRPL